MARIISMGYAKKDDPIYSESGWTLSFQKKPGNHKLSRREQILEDSMGYKEGIDRSYVDKSFSFLIQKFWSC